MKVDWKNAKSIHQSAANTYQVYNTLPSLNLEFKHAIPIAVFDWFGINVV